jgi:hypothetical protein
MLGNIHVIGLTETEMSGLTRRGAVNTLNGDVVAKLVGRFREKAGISADKVTLLAAHPVTVVGFALRVIVAATVTVIGLDERLRLEHILFVQA